MSDTAPSPPRRGLVLGLCGLTVVVVVALSLVLFLDDLDPVDDAPVTTEDPLVAADDFARADAPDLAADGRDWTEPAGDWVVQDGHAALVTAAPPPQPSLAVLDTGAADGVARATATAVEPGWAFAFRVLGPGDFWAVVARPETADWSLARVQGGVVSETTGFLAVAPTDGDLVEVHLQGDRITVTVGGVTNEVTDPALADATGIGPAALSDRNIASMAWDDLVLARR
jgi:hypothetical protein